jgi:hypothetical protein
VQPSTDGHLQPTRVVDHEHHAIVTIGDRLPHSRPLLSYPAPHFPTTILSLPETVRSGTGSVNPKPPAHGALAGSNQPWCLQGTRCDDPKTIEPVSAPNWHRFFGVRRLDEAAGGKLGWSATKFQIRWPDESQALANESIANRDERVILESGRAWLLASRIAHGGVAGGKRSNRMTCVTSVTGMHPKSETGV